MNRSTLSLETVPHHTLLGALVVNVVGEVDVISSVSLSDEISQAASTADQEVILNLEGVRFIDSSGLRVIVTAEAELSGAGLTLSIGGLSAAAQRVLS